MAWAFSPLGKIFCSAKLATFAKKKFVSSFKHLAHHQSYILYPRNMLVTHYRYFATDLSSLEIFDLLLARFSLRLQTLVGIRVVAPIPSISTK